MSDEVTTTGGPIASATTTTPATLKPAAKKPARAVGKVTHAKTPRITPVKPKPQGGILAQKNLSETTSDNPVPDPSGKTKLAYIYDAETDSLVRKQVSVELLSEPQDNFAHDPMGLGEDWDKGLGRELHARWANANPKYQTEERRKGYAPVRPDQIPQHLKSRFMVAEVEGIPGECIVYGDAVLFAVENWRFDIREARREKAAKARWKELFGFGEELDALNEKSRSQGWDTRFSAQNQTQIGGHIDDMGDPRESLHGGQRGVAMGEEYTNAMADAEIEAEMEARGGSPTYGGFQGNPAYNRTQWSRDAR